MLPSTLEPLRDVMELVHRSKIYRTPAGEFQLRHGGPTRSPLRPELAELLRWLDRQGRVMWVRAASGVVGEPSGMTPRLTVAAERLRAKWQLRYPDAKEKATQASVRDMLHRAGIAVRPGPPPLRLLPTPRDQETDEQPHRRRRAR